VAFNHAYQRVSKHYTSTVIIFTLNIGFVQAKDLEMREESNKKVKM